MSPQNHDATIDRATFAELQASAGKDFVGELVDTFFEEAPAIFDALQAALAAGHADAFRRAAHSLKSNGQSFGALKLGALARELELRGLPPDAAPLELLAREYAAVKTALTTLRDE